MATLTTGAGMSVEVVLASGCACGEGPVYLPDTHAVLFVDIIKKHFSIFSLA